MDDLNSEIKNLQEKGFVKTFLNFDKMITPGIIKIVFYVGLAFSVLISLGLIFSGLNSYYGGGAQFFLGLVLLVTSPIIVRVQCELLIIAFKIYEVLVDIKDK